MIFSMDELLKSNRKMALGVNFTLDGNGLTFIRFNDLRHENGYYARYGEASFMINAAFGLEVVEWLYLGGGILTTLHSSADFYTDIDLAGRTDKEGMSLNAKAVFSPVAAIFFSVDPVAIGLVYRGESHGEMVPITTNATNSVGGSKLVDLPIELLFKDAFVPANLSLGVSWDITESVMLAIDGIWYHWGEYDEIMTVNDLVRDEMNTDFVDTYVPKLGLEYQVIDRLFLRFGYSYEASPLRKAGDKGNYILDNDKHVGSLGIGYDLNIGLFNYPFSIDAAFFHHYLAPRELEGADGVKLESEGNLSGGTASITLRF
jgi:long-subunit fatty acid transport protein